MEWQKVAPVTNGGKPHFYVTFPVIEGKRRKITVAWDRNYKQWAVLYDDYESIVPVEKGFYATAQAALDDVNSLFPND
jgi:hypothetical protein